MMRRRWKWIRHRLEYLGLLLATKLIPLLPRGVCLGLARFVGFLMSIFDRPGRAVALSNLQVAFGNELSAAADPSGGGSILQRRKILRESYQQFARTMVDFLWSPRLTRQNFARYIELENFEQVLEAGGAERSIMIACFHYGNF